MIGLGLRRRSGRLTLGLRLGGIVGPTVATTLANSTLQTSAVSGFIAAYHAAFDNLAEAAGITLPDPTGKTVSAVYDLLEAAVTAAEQPPATIFNTLGTSTLLPSQIDGATAPLEALDTRLMAIGA